MALKVIDIYVTDIMNNRSNSVDNHFGCYTRSKIE